MNECSSYEIYTSCFWVTFGEFLNQNFLKYHISITNDACFHRCIKVFKEMHGYVLLNSKETYPYI